MSKGVEFLFRKNKITLVPGRGVLKARGAVEVSGPGGTETIQATSAILATGSEPKSLPGVPIDEKTVLSSNGAVRNEQPPKSIIVIGAGAVGVEFADVYASYGVQVTILEALPRLVPLEDEEVSKELARAFRRRSIEMKTGVKVTSVKPGGAGVTVETDAGRLEAEQVLMAVGRAAKVTGLGLEPLGVRLDRGFVTGSPRMETSVPGVYAIGDMVGPPLLAHKAMAEGVVAAEAIAGRDPRPLDYGNVPACTYCRPQIASIGVSEARAKENGREVSVGRFPFTAGGVRAPLHGAGGRGPCDRRRQRARSDVGRRLLRRRGRGRAPRTRVGPGAGARVRWHRGRPAVACAGVAAPARLASRGCARAPACAARAAPRVAFVGLSTHTNAFARRRSAMFGLGSQELIVILIIGLGLFGGSKLPELARSLGRSINEFKKGINEGAQAADAKEKDAKAKDEKT